jgi:hypothetical protein
MSSNHLDSPETAKVPLSRIVSLERQLYELGPLPTRTANTWTGEQWARYRSIVLELVVLLQPEGVGLGQPADGLS